jgi:redox-sensitive bicupin YhaK (pirin superfamily)
MIERRAFAELGRFSNDWLNARHHFSFGEYRDPTRMGFGRLRVWNDDEIAPGMGFDPHPHKDMEIVTYVRDGAITHRDNLGNEGRTEAGDVQVMHAGTGIVHAEYNLEQIPTRLFQIWIIPDRTGVAPGWATRRFPHAGDGLTLLASGQAGAGAALPLNADASVWAGSLPAGGSVRHAFGPGRGGYLVPINGAVSVDGVLIGPRDGVAISDLPEVTIVAREDVALVLVDIPV